MDIDGAANKGKGKAIATVSEESETNNQEASASLAKTVFILKLLTEILLTYASSVHILLRRDAEVSSCRGPPQKGASGNYSGGIFYHILHRFLPYSGNHKKEKKVDGDWRQKLATRASQLLVASCVRSSEARRRVFTEISHVLNDFVDSSAGFRPPDGNIHAFIDLLNDVLAARSPTGAYISAEASATFIDVGLVLSLTRTLQILDLDHADSPKVVTALVKVLEAVTKEHVISADPNSGKGENTNKPPEQNQTGRTDNGGDRFQSLETNSQPDRSEAVMDQIEPFTTVQASASSESTDDMEHDRDTDGGFAPGAEDDFMNGNSEEAERIENGIDSVGIRFEFSHNVQDNIGDEDDDEEMSGDDGDEGDEDEDEDEEDEDDEEHNDLEEDEVHHMSHGDTDQDDHEIDEDEFDEDVLEEEDDEDEDDEEGVILRLEEGINGINVFDHIEVFGRENSFPNDTLHVMPVEVFGSRRQGRTTSIYNLLGRSADHGAPSQHPLLMEPPSALHPVPPRQSESSADMIFSDRNLDSSSSRLDTIFRSLRNGRHGHRFNMWVDDNQQRGGSSATAIPQGLEELLVSQLRRPTPDKPSDQDTTVVEPQGKGEAGHLQESEGGVMTDAPAEAIVNNGDISARPSGSTGVDNIGNSDGRLTENDFHEREASSTHSQAVDMQYERNDAVVRDVEAVSQESSGSGATLGESLRSLEVEIGSADGHDDGGERQTSTDRLPLGDLQPTRIRRTNVSLGNANSSLDASLQSVTEVSENPDQGADQNCPADEQPINREAESGPIDPAFLDALPEDLRAEVLSAQQGQEAQPSNDQPQSAGDIDPEFLAALPPDIRAEVLAQQQAQRLHQAQELEGQPVEMDAVSIIATFPSDLREEVLLTSSDAILANLTPALVAEANMLRERFAHRYHSRTLFGMYPRNRRGESSRRGEAVGASLDRAGGGIASRRSMGGKLLEADGAPLVDMDALKAMIRLLRVVQPLYKGQLQRLLLNLCAHHETRTTLVQILMDMLMLDMRRTVNHLSNPAEPSYRLYACQSHVMYSRPQFLDGVPPLVSRRILETLTYLARNHPSVAKHLLQLEVLPQPAVSESESSDQARGKAVMIVEGEIESMQHQKGDFSIVLLLSLLSQPLYLRSIAHLEQLLTLLDVVIDNAENNSSSSNKSGESPVEQTSGSQMQDGELNVTGGSSSVGDVKPSKTDECLKPSSSGTSNECDTQAVLLSLPQQELRLLCSLLAREGYV
ncbi:hypothetical protein NE237_014317 [Protea cynaroides]|uniref:E3 ubiquitin-protein ligase HUWE1 n=1 Tax=Protea cynaroides TaxID=273540 RepID=A0A9Q0GKQ6_9MAGN|nr:hypothetical protein NE237_014317 [Protea cynaroides]